MAPRGTIALDFDGVLHSYVSGWTGPTPIDPPVEGARDAVLLLLESGFDVVVYTTRAESAEGEHATLTWLQQNRFPMDRIKVTATKPKAVLYVDDRGFRFEGSWSALFEYLDELGPDGRPGSWVQRR